jgi:peptide deformylase
LTRDILTFGADVLRKKSEPVKAVTDGLRRLVKDMLDTMYANQGAGLAAEQIGRTESVCVIDVSDARQGGGSEAVENADVPMPLVMLNPEIVAADGEQIGQEGCLSFPEVFVKIKRAQTVTARYMDLDGATREVHTTGLLARAIQHELDHLAGVLLVDRMSHMQKLAVSGRLKRLKGEPRSQHVS